MKSVVRVELDAPQESVAGHYADPRNSTKWMVELERYVPLTGEPGMPGSTYRLVSDQPHLDFVATVIERRLPDEVRLRLDAPSLSVDVHVGFDSLPDDRTRLVSTEVFRFKGLFGRAMSLFARKSIHEAHLKQMKAFKAYAERAHKGVRGLYATPASTPAQTERPPRPFDVR